MKHLFSSILLLMLFSCNSVEREINITNFENVYLDTLKPRQNGSYAAARYNISGKVNDTIKISFYGIEKYYFGKFEYDFLSDYYGSFDVEFIFDPYKATVGEITVKYGIY